MKKSCLTMLALLAVTVSRSVLAMELDAAIAGAEKNDPTLGSARANSDAAFENIAIARAKLLPQTSLQGSLQKLNEGVKQEGIPTPVGTDYQVNSYNGTVSLRQGLYRPRDWAGYDIGQLQAEYGAQKLASARSDLWLRTTNAWLDALASTEQRRIYGETVKATAFAAEQADKHFAAGEGTRDAMVEAHAQHALAKSQLLEAQINERSRRQALHLLTGLDPADLKDWHLPDFRKAHLTVANEEELQQAVSSTNPEILASRAVEQINKKRYEQAKADRLPTVDLVASKTWALSDTIATLNQRYNVFGAGVQVSIPLYDGGGLSATQRQAGATAIASSEDLRALELKLTTQVDADWASIDASLERANSAEILWFAAREQKRAAELGLKAGQRTWSDIAQAEILIARRAADFIAYSAAVLHAQAHLLSTLPVTENVWEPWVAQVSVLAK